MHKIAMLLLVVAAGFGVVGSAHAATDTTAQSQESQHKYTVAEGDSLSSIATANNLPSWMPLWDVNTDIQNPDQITPGEQIVIPVAPFPTDRPLPDGYAAPAAAAAAPAVTTSVRAARPAATDRVVGNPGGLAQRVCARESGCNYAANTGNGYYGAYQFDSGTWGGYGGYAEANQAPQAVQDAKFQQELAARGCSPWPNTCY